MNENCSARRFPPWVGSLLLVAGCLTPVVGWLIYENNRAWTVGKIEHLIRTELRPNCSREDVEAWFEKHGLKHGFSTDPNGAGMMGDKTPLMLAGLGDKEISGTAFAHIEGKVFGEAEGNNRPRANVGWLNGSITIRFFIDKQGRVIGHLVYPYVYSL